MLKSFRNQILYNHQVNFAYFYIIFSYYLIRVKFTPLYIYELWYFLIFFFINFQIYLKLKNLN